MWKGGAARAALQILTKSLLACSCKRSLSISIDFVRISEYNTKAFVFFAVAQDDVRDDQEMCDEIFIRYTDRREMGDFPTAHTDIVQ